MQRRETEATIHPCPIKRGGGRGSGVKINTSRNACLERSFPNLKAKCQGLVILAKYLKDSKIFHRSLPILLFLTQSRFHWYWLTWSSKLMVCRFIVALWFTALEDEEWGQGAPQPRVKPQLMKKVTQAFPFKWCLSFWKPSWVLTTTSLSPFFEMYQVLSKHTFSSSGWCFEWRREKIKTKSSKSQALLLPDFFFLAFGVSL